MTLLPTPALAGAMPRLVVFERKRETHKSGTTAKTLANAFLTSESKIISKVTSCTVRMSVTAFKTCSRLRGRFLPAVAALGGGVLGHQPASPSPPDAPAHPGAGDKRALLPPPAPPALDTPQP